MIDRQQLAAALARLDPRDREILYLSLRRRVPDEDLGEVFGGDASHVARMRAGAVERLSNDMGVQRGEDLGHMLKELLDPDTWQIKPVPEEETRAPGEGHRPVGAGDPSPSPAAARPADPDREPEPEPEPQRSPVLGMLEQRSPHEPSAAPAGRGPAGLRRLAVPAAVAVALLVPAGVVGALTSGEPGAGGSAGSDSGTRPFIPAPDVVGQPFPSDPDASGGVPGRAAEPRHGGLRRAWRQGQGARRRQDRVGLRPRLQRGRAARARGWPCRSPSSATARWAGSAERAASASSGGRARCTWTSPSASWWSSAMATRWAWMWAWASRNPPRRAASRSPTS